MSPDDFVSSVGCLYLTFLAFLFTQTFGSLLFLQTTDFTVTMPMYRLGAVPNVAVFSY
jgi:hypothetical protein